MSSHLYLLSRETLAEVMTDVAEHILDQHEREYSEEELEHAKKVELPVMIAKIDCVEHRDVCLKEGLMAYPTLRLFVDGERWQGGDYRGHRTVVEMSDWLQQVEDKHKEDLGDETKKNVQLAHQRKSSHISSADSDSFCLWIVCSYTLFLVRKSLHRFQSLHQYTPTMLRREGTFGCR